MKTDKAHLSTLWQNICAHSDQKAFEELFTLCYARLVKFAAEYLQSAEAAEEVVSDVFMKLWTGRQQFAEIAYIDKYLFTSVRNQSLNHLRQFSNYRIVPAGNELVNIVNSADPCTATEWRELLRRLDSAVEMLPPKRRMIFRLVREEGFKPKEVAEILHLSPRTVETQLFHAVKQLHAVLLPYLSQYKGKTRSLDALTVGALLAALLGSLGN